MNKYQEAMMERGRLTDLLMDDKVVGTMDIHYGQTEGKEIHHEEWSRQFDKCNKIIKEAFEKAEMLDKLMIEWFLLGANENRDWTYLYNLFDEASDNLFSPAATVNDPCYDSLSKTITEEA